MQSPYAHAPALLDALRGRRVLLAEDNEINREVALALLRETGLEVEVAVDGEQAITLASQRSYDLVLMDVRMPHTDGLQATRVLRLRYDAVELPILAITAHAFDEDRHACLEAGMNDHIAKPVDPEVLFAALLRWMPPRPPAAGAGGTAAEHEAALRAALAQIPGLDLAQGLQALRGRLATYLRLLQLFVDTHEGDAELLRQSHGRGDLEGVRQLAHALKGSAGSLGLTRLQGLAAEIETALKPGEPDAGLAGAVLKRLATELPLLVAALRPWLATSAEPN